MDSIINVYLFIGIFLTGSLFIMGYTLPHTLKFFRYPRIYKQVLSTFIVLLIIGIALQYIENPNCEDKTFLFHPLFAIVFLLLYKIADIIALKKLNRHMYYLTSRYQKDEESKKSTLKENIVQYLIYFLSIYIPLKTIFWILKNWYSC